ncbi:transposase [Saccharopolyspora shandongensis]|uniref:transposase n=1 Tax=Saccharopolyspora shandongensis TaxID=418495 RepID=UPI0033FC0751
MHRRRPEFRAGQPVRAARDRRRHRHGPLRTRPGHDGHWARAAHGGRRARVRGLRKVAADFSLLAAAVNLARLGTLGITSAARGWATITA